MEVANGPSEIAENDSVPKFGSFELAPEVANEPVAHDTAAVALAPAQMTFMQSSELEESVSSKIVEPAPQESAVEIETRNDKEPPVAAPAAPFSAPALDWTVEDDDDLPTAQNLQDTFALGSEPTTSGVVTPVVAPPAQPEPVKEVTRSANTHHQGGRRGGRQGHNGPANGKTAAPEAGNKQPNVDEDGFQVAQRKGRGGPSGGQSPSFRGGRGRGGQGGERGRGGFRGRGGPGGERGIRRGFAGE